MRNYFNPDLKKILLIALFPCIFFSCKKDITTNKNDIKLAAIDESSLKMPDGLTKIVLQTCEDDQIWYLLGNAGSYNNNLGQRNEVAIYSWSNNGYPAAARGLYKFDSLSKIPSTAQVISAQLRLYGVPNSSYTPQGNSTYPGSPYNAYGDNTCIIQRIVKDNWYENTATWNTQPPRTKLDQDTIPPSTSQWNYNVVVDVTKLVRRMVADSSANYGFRIKLLDESIYKSIVFASAQYADSSKRPKLVVNYK
ncbi:MAG: DNRLRE domain-containing protein [Chitinophagaceae bacterium]